MQRYLLAAVAVAAIASPAAARDGSFYGGIEAGVVFPRDTDANVDVLYTTVNVPGVVGTPAGPANSSFDDAISLDAKTGYDIGFFGGYDFGMFRVEGEVDWKHANLDDISADSGFLTSLNNALNGPGIVDSDVNVDERSARCPSCSTA
jgi:opacity protein-like surface antigen